MKCKYNFAIPTDRKIKNQKKLLIENKTFHTTFDGVLGLK